MAGYQDSMVLYDGQCGFCARWVRFARLRDRTGSIRFLPLQSEEAAAVLAPYELEAKTMESVVLIKGESIYTQSSAVVRILAALRFPWCCLSAGWMMPRFLRDALYRCVARHRMCLQSCSVK